MTDTPLLEVQGLGVSFPAGSLKGLRVAPIEDISFSLRPAERVAIVGESGSGKTTLGLALLRLLPLRRGLEVEGGVRFEGRDVLGLKPAELTAYRGGGVGLIPQDPMTSLNPTLTIGRQVGEAAALNDIGADVRRRTLEALAAVRIPEPENRLGAYPHQFSGGMRQRAVSAMAIARGPRLLIADEPTTALDVTVQRQFIDMLSQLCVERAMALMLITHDLGVAARIAERIIVMYAGEIVEDAPTRDILDRPRHWYTAALIASARDLAAPGRRLRTIDGQPPTLVDRPMGCRFAPRCPHAGPACGQHPGLAADGPTRRLRCWRPRTTP